MSAERLREIADELQNGGQSAHPTVREFLSWFGAQRRGHWIVDRIRTALAQAGLQTAPDFQSAYIDSPIEFVLAAPAQQPEDQAQPDREERTALAAEPYADPTYRISKLAAANRPPVSVRPDTALQEAVTIMLANDFSQLPVATSDRDVKGVISWQSVGSRLALGRNGNAVREFMDQHHEIRLDASLFAAIGTIVQHQYVLIRGPDQRITGIVTTSDLSLQFRQLAEPFLLLGEIENHVRRIISERFDPTELAQVRDPEDQDRQVESVADLTFGEYIRLLEGPDRWDQLGLAIHRGAFIASLDRVRGIRNDVMHFDPDGIPDDDLEALRDFARFLQQLQTIGVT